MRWHSGWLCFTSLHLVMHILFLLELIEDYMYPAFDVLNFFSLWFLCGTKEIIARPTVIKIFC
jgi:hypothetical protein